MFRLFLKISCETFDALRQKVVREQLSRWDRPNVLFIT